MFERISSAPGQRKRKSEESVDAQSRSGKLRKTEADKLRKTESSRPPVMIFDAKTILGTMKLPTKDEVPGLPSDLLRSPKTILHNSFQGHATMASDYQGQNSGVYKVIASIRLLDKPVIRAIGEGENKRDAERAAHLHLVAKMHEQALLSDVFEAPISKRILQDQKDAKLDVYIYAAKYGLIPDIEISTQRKGRLTTYMATITLPEHGIKVVAQNQRRDFAEISASVKFKQKAEKYVSDQAAQTFEWEETEFSVGSAKSFFTWYKQKFPATQFDIEVKSSSRNVSEATALLQNEPIGKPITMGNKKTAEEVATLVAAVQITKDKPRLKEEFFEVYKKNNNKILHSLGPANMHIDKSAIELMRNTLNEARRSGLGDQYDDIEPSLEGEQTNRPAYRQLSPMEVEFRSKELKQKYQSYLADARLATLRQTRADFPMNQYSKQVLDIVQNNVYSIIVGATGSGKTTQVPQILLNEAIERGEGGKYNIICTQPRRIAAKSIAQRVAEERSENLQNSIGYHVKRDAKLPRLGGSVTYCTTGILSQQLQNSADDVLDRASHLIIDEIHERDIIIDFLLTTLKKIVAERIQQGRHVPRIVLMSATIDSEMFADYFQIKDPYGRLVECPTLNVPGRTFPVKERHLWEILDTMRETYGPNSLMTMNRDQDTREYLEAETTFARENPSKNTSATVSSDAGDQETSVINWKLERGKALKKQGMSQSEAEEALIPHGLVATTIAHIAKTTTEGAILVFLPGLENILKVSRIIQEQSPLGVNFNDESKYRTFMLHSSIADAQRDVFDPLPPGCRKIILATNIAETSITIPDVQYVVDTAKMREKQYNQLQRITKLACVWVSKSNVKQRAGRAGRVQDGNYYALYPKERFESMRAVGLPELLRSDLQEVCLDVRAQGFKEPVKRFLSNAIEPPSMEAVDGAMRNLTALDCLTADEQLTPLGRLLASLPIHPSLGKMIVLGVIYKCLDPLLITGALFNERSLFISPVLPDAKKAMNESKEDYAQGTGSDAIASLNAFKEMRYTSGTRGLAALGQLSSRKYLHVSAFKSVQATTESIASVLEENQIIYKTAAHQRADFQVGDPSLNINSDKLGLVKALILAGVYPNIGRNTHSFLYRTPGAENVMIHPSSVNAVPRPRKGQQPIHKPGNELVSYSTLALANDGNSTYMRDSTQISPLMTCLFGGHLELAANSARIIKVDEWLPFYLQTTSRLGPGTIIDFRKGLEKMHSEAFAALYKRTLLEENVARSRLVKGTVEILDIDINGAPKGQSGWDKTVSTWTDEERRSRSGQKPRVAGNASADTGHFNDWDKILDSWRPPAKEPRGNGTIDRYVPKGSKLAHWG